MTCCSWEAALGPNALDPGFAPPAAPGVPPLAFMNLESPGIFPRLAGNSIAGSFNFFPQWQDPEAAPHRFDIARGGFHQGPLQPVIHP